MTGATFPEITNRDAVSRALREAYPPVLREGGIGGMVSLWVRVTPAGRPDTAVVGSSSGYAGLDRAALQVADVLRFEPAMNGTCAVRAWVSFPVTFISRQDPATRGP